MNWFWKLFGYKSFKPKVGDIVRIETLEQNLSDHREIIKKHALGKIQSVVLNSEYCMSTWFYHKPYIYNISNSRYCACHDYATVLYHPKIWGGMKPLSDEDKVELL